MKLSKLAEIFNGVEVTKANLDPTAGEPYRLVQCHDLMGTEIARRVTLRTVYLNSSTDPERLVIRFGDILASLATERVAVLVLNTHVDWCIPHVHVAVVRPRQDEFRARILDYLASGPAQTLLTAMKRGPIVRRIFIGDLRTIDVP